MSVGFVMCVQLPLTDAPFRPVFDMFSVCAAGVYLFYLCVGGVRMFCSVLFCSLR
jgi:hypothetical protein